MTKPTTKKSPTPSPEVVHLQVTPTSRASDASVLTLAQGRRNSMRLSKSQKQLLASAISEIQSRVRLTEPVLAEAERSGTADLGPFPVLAISTTSLVAVYLAILAERDLVAQDQIIWPEIQGNTDLNNLESLCCLGEDFCSAIQDYLQPRIHGNLVSAPFEFLPYSPRGLSLVLAALPSPNRDEGKRKQKPSFHIGCFWCTGNSSLFSAPKVAWQAIEIAELYLGSFTIPVQDEAIDKNVCDLTEVEVLPQVSPFGLAALWLAALRHEKLVTSTKEAWPALFRDDLLYMSTFGNTYTKLLVKTFLVPMQKGARSKLQAKK